MKRLPISLLMAGLASFAVGCSHNKQKIVYVTEYLVCENLLNACGEYSTEGSFRGHENAKFDTELDAAASVCAGMSMHKSEFVDRVNADKFRVISTTDWMDESQTYKVNNGDREYNVQCIGKEYIVSY